MKEAPRSLLYQSRVDRKRLQADGWGIGWFENGRPRIVKSPKPIYRDRALLRRGVKRAKGRVLVGHVRWASNPLKLPKHRLIGHAHAQPFSFGRWLFAHNGTLFIPKEVREALGPLGRHIKGNNDSEVLFYWLMKHGVHRSASNIRRAIDGLDAIWKKCRKKYPLYKYPYHGLNWVLTDGKVLIAMCYVNAGGFGKAKALCRREEPYYQLHYRRDSNGWIVASEPLDEAPGWKSLRHGQILIAKLNPRRIVDILTLHGSHRTPLRRRQNPSR